MSFKDYSKKEKSMKYEVLQTFGKISTDGKMNKELRLIAWNGNDPKYDIRSWGVSVEGNETMSKGITFTATELQNLFDLLCKLNDNEDQSIC